MWTFLKNIYSDFSDTMYYDPEKEKNIYCEILPFKIPNNDLIVEILEKYTRNRFSWLKNIISKNLGLFYSKSGTRIKSSDWDDNDRAIMDKLYEDVRVKINNWDKRPATLHKISYKYFGRIYALKYDGVDSGFGWHYDSLSQNEYRAIFTVKQTGNRRVTFRCMKPSQTAIYPDIGEGILIRSGETFHTVQPDKVVRGPDDGDQVTRWVLVFTYTTIENDNREYVGTIDEYFRNT